MVEFYGLGGSKSLEIVPPLGGGSRGNDGELIIAKNPYRISDYYNWGHKINTTLEIIASNASHRLDAFVDSGFNKPFLVKSAQKINHVIQSFIKKEDSNLEALNKKVNNSNYIETKVETNGVKSVKDSETFYMETNGEN